MGKGKIYPAEGRAFSDAMTGARVRQVTAHPSIHHHPFYYIPCFDDAMQRLFFASHRTGTPQLFAEARASGQLLQLTDRQDLGEWSIHPTHDGDYVYFTTSEGAWRIDCETLREECLLQFSQLDDAEFSTAARGDNTGQVGAAMGTTTLSHDDRYWAVPVAGRSGDKSITRFVIIDVVSGRHDVILERDSIAHPEFHPSDNTLLRYGGPYHSRIWVIDRDGANNRLAYQRDEAAKEWIVHETWRPGSREIVTANWPHGCMGIDIDGGSVRQICSFNAWHPAINRQGDQMCADTNFPDTGLQLFNPRDGVGEPTPLCLSESSNAGAHWNTDHCPYDDGPVAVYAPQHTHPHPCFSPDGCFVVFTSDRSGFAQIYEVEVPAF